MRTGGPAFDDLADRSGRYCDAVLARGWRWFSEIRIDGHLSRLPNDCGFHDGCPFRLNYIMCVMHIYGGVSDVVKKEGAEYTYK